MNEIGHMQSTIYNKMKRKEKERKSVVMEIYVQDGEKHKCRNCWNKERHIMVQ